MPARQAGFCCCHLLGCAAAQARAAPPILLPLGALPLGAFLQSNYAVETVRWRYRHYRDLFWNGRADGADRGDSDPSNSSSRMRSLNSATPGVASEIFGPQFVAAAAGWTHRPRARNAHDEVPPAPQGSRAPVYSPRVSPPPDALIQPHPKFDPVRR